MIFHREHPDNEDPAEVLLAVRFRIFGALRFLSHAETVTMLHRAISRAGVDMVYSCGFNPRPRMSLPLPRSVSVESDDELMCIRVNTTGLPEGLDADISGIKTELAYQLPKGCEIVSVGPVDSKKAFQKCRVEYEFRLKDICDREPVTEKIGRILDSSELMLKRRIDAKGNTRYVDVRGFLISMNVSGEKVLAECFYSTEGSVRVEELMGLLDISYEDISSPPKRKSVCWIVDTDN